MHFKFIASAIVLVAAAAGTTACQQVPDNMTVAEFCSNPDNHNKDVCKVNVEIDGQKRALAETNMSLTQARQVADSALSKANVAQQSADAAMATASAAKAQNINCVTQTIKRSKTGACSPGYKLLSCTQTHYTSKAGAPSILREISDTGCRYQDKVLEMQVRCCVVGDAPPVTEAAATPTEPQKPAAPSQPTPAT